MANKMMKRGLSWIVSAVTLACAAAFVQAMPMPSNLVFHLDASDPLENGGATLPSNLDALPTWKNLASSSIPDAVKATEAATNPVWYSAAGPNGKPAVRLNTSSSAFYRAGTAADFNFMHDQTSHTVFAVVQTFGAPPSTQIVLDTGSGYTGGNNGYTLQFWDFGSFNDVVYAGFAENGNYVARTTGLPANAFPEDQWGLVAEHYNTSLASLQLKLYVNGSLIESDSESGVSPTGTNGFSNGMLIGADMLTNSLLLRGYVSEVLIYNRALDGEEVKTVNQYLETKYALGITAVPEPISAALLLAGMSLVVRRKKA